MVPLADFYTTGQVVPKDSFICPGLATNVAYHETVNLLQQWYDFHKLKKDRSVTQFSKVNFIDDVVMTQYQKVGHAICFPGFLQVMYQLRKRSK